MRSKRKTLLAAALLSLAAAAQAADVITLNWRDGDEVAAALRPQLRDGEKLGALGNQLILDAPPGRSAELRRLIRQLDVKSSSLLVEVAQDGVSRANPRCNWAARCRAAATASAPASRWRCAPATRW